MPVIFGVDAGDTRTVERVRVNNPRSTTVAVADVAALVYAFDMTQLTDPAVRLRMVVEVSADDGITWRERSACDLSGGATTGRGGESPRGQVELPKGTTHVRSTLIPLVGNPTVGLWVKAI